MFKQRLFDISSHSLGSISGGFVMSIEFRGVGCWSDSVIFIKERVKSFYNYKSCKPIYYIVQTLNEFSMVRFFKTVILSSTLAVIHYSIQIETPTSFSCLLCEVLANVNVGEFG